ncbi:MAG: T9SS type A sorting domain-containing protein [Chlorobi bacterium]|nr:T9SS type A sorting domain-containing protein [Chlorobiota bacterium]
MKKLLTLIISLAIFGIAFSQTNVSGTISSNTTWNLAGSPYIVTGNLTVAATYTLTINSGVEVKFDNGRSMYAYGHINATSTVFTSNDGSPAPGKWNYLTFYSGSTSTFTNCTIEYGRYLDVYSGGSFTMSGGVIENMYQFGIYSSGTVNVSNAIIDLTGYVSSGHGIQANGSGVTSISNTSILNCNYGIYVTADAAQVSISSCTLSSNNYPLYLGNTGDLTVTGSNTFTGNTYDVFYVYPSAMGTNWSLPYVNVPFYFRTSFTVNNGSTLTIADENILKFSSGLYIRGTLTANAGVGQNIYFTSYRDDNWGGDSNGDGTATAPAVGNWSGIYFYDESNDASVMRRCMVRYAGGGSAGGVTLLDASPTIDLCDFSQNYFGAYFQYASNPTFTNNTIGSSTLTPIAMSFEANPTFTNNVLSFSDNQYDAIGLIGGTLTADAHIIKRNFTTVNNITYYMLSTIIVPPAYTLTIDPGIVIKSSTYSYRIQIQGKLIADGTPADRIVLTSVKDDNFGNPGDTNKDGTITTPTTNDISAIIFENGYDPTSIVDNVTIKYASVYNYYYSNGGSNHYVHAGSIITLSQTAPSPAGPTISNCEVREAAYGVSAYQASNPILSNNNFINITQTPLSLSGSANPTYSGNTYVNCGLNALGLIGHNVVVDGTISKRNVAGYNNITYVLLEDITVKNGTNLDIDPGVVIKIQGKRWYIDGGFKINGTVSEHVIFTSLYDDNVGNPMDTNGDGNATTPSRGNWGYIEFKETSDDAYCAISYADLQYGGSSSYGTIWTLNASPSITNTLIDQSSGYGIRCDGNSAPTYNYVDIQNSSSDPIAMSLTSNPAFSNISFTANGSNGIFILEGTLSANATLNKRNIAGFTNIAYIIDELSISSGFVLTLEAGIVIKFRGSYFDGIRVHGGLSSVGTSSQKIIFTSFKDDSAGGDTNNDGNSSVPGNSDWEGLMYYPEGDDAVNKLIYSEVRYAGGTSYTFDQGAVQVKDAYVQIDHVVFQQGNYSGIGIFGSANPSITNCQIYNFTAYPIYMAMFSNPTFSGNTLANIKYTAIGIKNETYSQTATIPQRNFAGYSNITYMFGSITINSGTTITIPAGTVIKGGSFTVNGKLQVDGTPGNPVVFTDYRDDDYGNPADTEQNGSASTPTTSGVYFRFNDVSDDASYIDQSIIRYVSNPVQLYSASPTISNNTFDQISNYGITNSGVCAPNITDNTFNDLTLAPLQISLVSFPATLSGNTITGTTYKGIAVNYETLTQDVTLPKRPFGGISNIPYIFSNYTIGTGVTLTIDPGVICKFTSGYMNVNNGLIAEGLSTSGNRIVFTSITDDFYGGDTNADGDATAHDYSKWSGIRINDVALDPLTRFEYCIFRHVSSQGAIYTTSASPSILNCSFNNCYGGVYATGASNPTINYCDFDGMTYYMAVNNVNQSFVIDAENCWWGDNSGPTHSGNPGGTGEEVSDGVDYDPYGTSGAINPLLGDASLNSIVQAYDASLILQHVVGSITLNPTQQGVADVSGAAGITAYDGSLILQYVVGLINYFPAALLSPAPAPVSEVELMVGNAEVDFGETFALPLTITDVSDLYAMGMTISFDPEILEAVDVENLISGMNVNFSIDNETGTIKIAFAGIEPLEYAMDAANIIFKVNENVNAGLTTPVVAKSFMGNETDLSWNVTDGSVSVNGFTTGFGNDLENGKTQLSCYPNPFSNQLNIDYQISGDKQKVAILVYDIYGKMVAEIANGEHDAATYNISWNGIDQNGNTLRNGTYFIRMISQDNVVTRKIQIVR